MTTRKASITNRPIECLKGTEASTARQRLARLNNRPMFLYSEGIAKEFSRLDFRFFTFPKVRHRRYFFPSMVGSINSAHIKCVSGNPLPWLTPVTSSSGPHLATSGLMCCCCKKRTRVLLFLYYWILPSFYSTWEPIVLEPSNYPQYSVKSTPAAVAYLAIDYVQCDQLKT